MNIALISDSLINYKRKGCEITFIPSSAGASSPDWSRFDAAFLVAPVSENAVISWTGHPHVRYLDNVDKIDEEITYILKHIECEKKLLIKLPDFTTLEKYHPSMSVIEQVYLNDNDCSRRIRKREFGSYESYIETAKIRVTGAVSKEFEKRIDKNKYNELLLIADEEKHPIKKKRYCFFYKRQYFELDVFDFWDDRAILEIELKSEDEGFTVPPELEVIADVTDDKRYKNNYLAGVGYEDYKTEFL